MGRDRICSLAGTAGTHAPAWTCCPWGWGRGVRWRRWRGGSPPPPSAEPWTTCGSGRGPARTAARRTGTGLATLTSKLSDLSHFTNLIVDSWRKVHRTWTKSCYWHLFVFLKWDISNKQFRFHHWASATLDTVSLPRGFEFHDDVLHAGGDLGSREPG